MEHGKRHGQVRIQEILKTAINTISSEGQKIQIMENLKLRVPTYERISGLGAREGNW